ncbi:MAG: hypothetical protein NVS4B3_16850 [Gemmatimonadaceae bacterium]
MALAECVMADRDQEWGAVIDLTRWVSLPRRALLFGEAQSRVILSTADAATVLAIAAREGVPACQIGYVAASTSIEIRIGYEVIVAPVTRLADAYHGALPSLMAGSVETGKVVTRSTV